MIYAVNAYRMLRCSKNPCCMNDKRGPEIDTEIFLSIFKNSVQFIHNDWYKINGHNMMYFHICTNYFYMY